ncbi:MAG: 4-alpha-glucanotransferase [Anaerolineales bacterium]
MNYKRASGILLHPTSLPGPYGIGDLGPAAHAFVDWLADSGCTLWQVLPLGPTGYGDSPYQSFSVFAGNPYLISPDFLLRDGLLHPDDITEKVDFLYARVDYGRIIPWKLNLLERAFLRFSSDPGPARRDYERFCAENVAWLPDYALFMALKEAHGGGAWSGWPEELRKRDPAVLTEAGRSLADAVARFTFYQFVFFRQWYELREHAHQRGVRIIGDLPIFAAYDSADVWVNPELFHLGVDDRPTVVAGVPPDYFSPTGQLWGNPLYRWEMHRQTGYAWWLARFEAALQMVDIVRLDHFRGFAGYWEVPAGSPTAEHGRWVPGPGADFFQALEQKSGAGQAPATATGLPIIAEDLGEITPDVIALREQFGLPGMKILQFGFSGPENLFLPHHYPLNCVVYTGTHDNDTARGWYLTAPASERAFAERYLQTDEAHFPEALVRAAWSSVAVFALAPMQDLLGLGTEARMNYPSRLGGNWAWRMDVHALSEQLQERLKELNYLYARC